VSDWQQILIAVLGTSGLVGGLIALARAFLDRPKTRADAVKIIADAATVTVDNISKRLDRVEKQSAEQDEKIGRLTEYVDRVSGWAVRHRPYDIAVRGIADEHRHPLPPLEEFPEFVEWREHAPAGGNHA